MDSTSVVPERLNSFSTISFLFYAFLKIYSLLFSFHCHRLYCQRMIQLVLTRFNLVSRQVAALSIFYNDKLFHNPLEFDIQGRLIV